MITIRKARPEDRDPLHALRARAIRETCSTCYPREDMDRWASGPPRANLAELLATVHYFVAEEDGRIVGGAFITPTTARIDAVFVDPAYQRRGIGAQLLAAIEQVAIETGLASMNLESTLNAVEFYKALGFVELKRGKYQSPSTGVVMDCVYMDKNLVAGK